MPSAFSVPRKFFNFSNRKSIQHQIYLEFRWESKFLSFFPRNFGWNYQRNSDAICIFRLEFRLYFYLRSTKLLLLVGVFVGFAGSIFEILCNMDLILPSLLSLLSTWSNVPVIRPLSDESFELSVIRFFQEPYFLVYILCPW